MAGIETAMRIALIINRMACIWNVRSPLVLSPTVRTHGKRCILCATAATNTFRSGKYLDGLVWFGLVWFGLVWFGLGWAGLG